MKKLKKKSFRGVLGVKMNRGRGSRRESQTGVQAGLKIRQEYSGTGGSGKVFFGVNVLTVRRMHRGASLHSDNTGSIPYPCSFCLNIAVNAADGQV